uniref:Phosphate transporter n=1 Tax=Lotharella globosa TaxID=91324 RepID=A0A7S3ZFK7_9EUKA|mmetsp:Transcript_32183/g.62183  ORF Transcript_32183/g.62183 Transcript_32183/m.62183 type:complete len:500 (+) Transcript_32183:67-1566(+)
MDWLVPLAAIFMCCNAFGVGANDVANAWGTSVASGAIKLRKACLIAGFANILGAVTLGYGVSDAIQKGVADIEDPECWACGYCNSRMSLYAVGMFGALVGSSVFLLLATFSSAPVSGTHAIVGGVVGMTLAGTSGACLDWSIGGLGGIALSWVLSPVVAGFIGAGLYVFTDKFIMRATDPRTRSLTFMPIFVALSCFIIVFLVLLKSKVTKDALPVYGHFFLGVVAGIIGYFGGWFWRDKYVVSSLPSQTRKELNDHHVVEMDSKAQFNQDEVGAVGSVSGVNEEEIIEEIQKQDSEHPAQQEQHVKTEPNQNKDQTRVKDVEDPSREDAVYVFKYLIVFNAALESFAHGSNDTGNATAPFSAVFNTVNEGIHSCKAAETPEWVLFVAGCCVALGVNTFGYRVMRTVGEKITVVNFHKGFCMEFASTAAVVIATLLRFPVSTTHCQIGAVMAVGLVSVGYKNVSFGVLGQIVLSWIITLPFAGLFAAMMLAIIQTGIER